MVSPCSRMRSAFTVTSLSNVEPGSSSTVRGNAAPSSGMVFLAKLIIDTSSRHPATDGTVMAKPPSFFDVLNFLILPSAPLMMTDAPVSGSPFALFTTVPDTLTCATALTAASSNRRYVIISLIDGNRFRGNRIRSEWERQARGRAFRR